MSHLLLQREKNEGSEACTPGKLLLPNGVQPFTLELPWVFDLAYPGGHPDISCVPAGLYDLVLHDTLKHPKSFALVNRALGVIHEPDPTFPNARTVCLLHVADTVADLEGCIGLGMLRAGPCVIRSSVTALEIFNRQVPWVTGHTLEIREPGA